MLLFIILLLVWITILLVRTFQFKPEKGNENNQVSNDSSLPLNKVAADRFKQLIRIPTVNNKDKCLVDEQAFSDFQALLPSLYPNVYKNCTFEQVGKHGLLYHWKGTTNTSPSIFMAHYDVVPVEEEKWEHPPFSAFEKDGVIWGRGTLDTKGTFFSILESAEKLITDGFVPKQDIYLAFGGDEEIMGEDAPSIVSLLKSRNIRAGFVLDEGGAIVEKVFPGVTKPSALIGIAEKGSINVKLHSKSTGGHASAPLANQSVVTLAKAIEKINKKGMPFTLSKPVKEMFNCMGSNASFPYRLLFANLWCFAPLLNLICKKSGGELNALVRTTTAFTTLSGSNANNVLPPASSAGINIRIIPGETKDSVKKRIETIVGNNIEVELIDGNNPCPVSKTEGEPYKRLKDAIIQSYPNTLVSPYLMIAASDSRHYTAISDYVFRFSGMPLSKEERLLIHNHNERISTSTLRNSIKFFTNIIKSC